MLQRLVGVSGDGVRGRLHELEAEAEAQLDAMAPAYAAALLQHATYRQPHQDALFFSALYEARPQTLNSLPQNPAAGRNGARVRGRAAAARDLLAAAPGRAVLQRSI